MKLSPVLGALASLFLIVATAPAKAAEAFHGGLKLPAKAAIEMTVISSREAGDATSSATTRVRQTIEKRPGGFRVSQTSELTAGDTKGQALVTVARSGPIDFEADGDLKPVRILNWEALLERVRGMTPASTGLSQAALGPVQNLLPTLTPETGALSILKEQLFLAQPMSMDLKAGQPQVVDIAVGNPFGGAPIDAVRTIRFDGRDATTGRAVITITEILDTASANTALRDGMRALGARTPGGQPKATEAQIASMIFDRVVTCRYEVEAPTGLPAQTDCSITTLITTTGAPSKTVERWVISQSLVTP